MSKSKKKCTHKFSSGKLCGRVGCTVKHKKTGEKQGKNGNPPPKEHQFKKGESGNPNGRPKGSKNISTIIKNLLDEQAPGALVDSKFVKEFAKKVKNPTNADAAACRILYEGLILGERWALVEIMDRTEGKADQAIELSGNVGFTFEDWKEQANENLEKAKEQIEKRK